MRDITLSKLKERFHPNLTQTQFAEYLGYDVSTVNKIMHGTYNCSLRSKVWKDLKEKVRTRYGLMLISEMKTDREKEKLDKEVWRLTKEVEKKDREIDELMGVIQELTTAVRIMSDAKQSVSRAKFVLSAYKNNRKEE